MHDADAMRGVERAADLNRQPQRVGYGQGPLLETCGQRLAVEELHHQELDVSLAADIMNRADVRVVERGDRARFLLEAKTQVGIAGQRSRHHLDRHGAIETGVARFVDLAHPARPEGSHDFVGAEAGSGRQRHAIAPIIVR